MDYYLNLDAVYVMLSLLGIFCTTTGVVDLSIRKEHGRGIFPARSWAWGYILGGSTLATAGVFHLVQMGVQ